MGVKHRLSLLDKLLNGTVQALTRRPDGSWYLRVDEGIEITPEETEEIWQIWGEVHYRVLVDAGEGRQAWEVHSVRPD